MIAYKFLLANRRGPFSRAQWPAPGEWLDTDGPLVECRNGIHACRPEELAYWLGEELWELELDGDLVARPLKILARRGRLGARVEAWDDAVQREFAEMCVLRTARHAADALDAAGLAEPARALAQADALPAVARAAGDAARHVEPPAPRRLSHMVGYVREALGYLESAPASVVAYIGAHAADAHRSTAELDAFAAEREHQSRWLAERLDLRAPSWPGPATARR